MPSIPVRNFSKHGDQISMLGLGGHHLGDAEDEQTAIQIVHEAVDGGITFFDNCWEREPKMSSPSSVRKGIEKVSQILLVGPNETFGGRPPD